LKCPHCQSTDYGVIDSRPSGNSVWRRRKCNTCQQRFTTYESVEKDSGQKSDGILAGQYQKIVVLNLKTGEEIAVITDGDTPINTASDNIVVKLTPTNCDTEIVVERPLRHERISEYYGPVTADGKYPSGEIAKVPTH